MIPLVFDNYANDVKKSKMTANSCKERNSERVAKTTKNRPPPHGYLQGKKCKFLLNSRVNATTWYLKSPIGYSKSPIRKKLVLIGKI